ncbi:hypothetical protein KKE74_03170 [Patescibacteria group bacterium]|nr:hypothetical protein [Patescibacteria group bacterium]
MSEQEQKKPNLAPGLKIYGKTGGYFKKTDKEVNEIVEKNKEKRKTEIAKKKVAEAVEKGEIKFGTESKEASNKKPTFEEYKAAEQAKQEEALEKAREKLKEKYEKAA